MTARSPLRAGSFSIGETGATSVRSLPGALPAGPPFGPGLLDRSGRSSFDAPILPRRSPRLPPPTMFATKRATGTGRTSRTIVGSGTPARTRLLPGALPEGAPLDNVGTQRAAPLVWRCSQHCQERHPAEGSEKAPRKRGEGGTPRIGQSRCQAPTYDLSQSPVPGTRSNAQAWTTAASHRVPGTVTRDRSGESSFDAPSPRRALRGSLAPSL
jgi:hypothetical protein